MALTDQKTKLAHNLKTLTIHANDSVRGYEIALEKVPAGSEAAEVIRKQLGTRQFHRDLLNDRLTIIGEEGEERGSAEGKAHRALIDLKSWLTDKDETEAILNECIRGEEKLSQYIDATFEDIPIVDPATGDIIMGLKDHVQGSILALKTAQD
ncbi:MAG: DUF2383 domain-containing protein [Opitutales bacterium]